MALINCPECGKEISDKSTACVHCGCPISTVVNAQYNQQQNTIDYGNKEPRKNRKKHVILFTIITFIIIVLVTIIGILNNSGDKIDTKCNAGHSKGSWELTKEATLVSVGVEEIFCSVCGESLDSRGTECKKAKVNGYAFNFKDEEFIEWVNSWNKRFEVSSTELGMKNLSSSNTSYKVKLESTGSEGILILNHDSNQNISGIMAYFDNPIESAAFISVIAQKIEYDFSTEKAGEELIDNKMAYTVGEIVVMRVQLSDDMEVVLLAPFEYIGDILSGSSLTKNDCLASIEKNNAKFAKYNYNIWKYILNEYGEDNCCWFYHDDTETETETEDSLGEIKTFRGIVLSESTYEDVISAYGQGIEFSFNKNTDILYCSMKSGGATDCKYLDDTQKVIVYTYKNKFQIVFYLDYSGTVDFILYTDGIWYE